MVKFFYVIFMNLFRAPYMIPKMRYQANHPEKFSEKKRYNLVCHAIRLMKRTGRIHTIVMECQKQTDVVQTGSFGADMKVSLLNDGPFTVMLDSQEIC